MSNLFVITGLSGTGKSSILRKLRTSLLESEHRLRDLDASGVPTGADNSWRVKRVHSLLEKAETDAAEGIQTVLCGTLLPADFANSSLPQAFCLLQADPETIRARLLGRYASDSAASELFRVTRLSPAGFIHDLESNRAAFEHAVLEHPKVHCVDTSSGVLAKSANEVLSWLLAAARHQV